MSGRVIVAGTRGKRVSVRQLDKVITNLQCNGVADHVDTWEVVHGSCANSPDEDGAAWAISMGLRPTPFPADWKKYGKAAGPIRNLAMAKYAAEADFGLLIAFWDGKSTGTQNMIANACAERLHVVVVRV